ncbi:hypothetical protein D3C87_931580 [compost metagenome]
MFNLSKNEAEVYLFAAEKPTEPVRLHRLENGTVFTIDNNKFKAMLLFEDKRLYDVVYKGHDEFGPMYEKTGVSYSTDELNELLQS